MFLLGVGLFYSPELTANADPKPLDQEGLVTAPDTTPIAENILSRLNAENPTREPMILLDGKFIGYGAPAMDKVDTSKIAMVNEIA